MWNFESDQSEILCSNRFPARGIVRYTGEGSGCWRVVYENENIKKWSKNLAPIKIRNQKKPSKVLDTNFILNKHCTSNVEEVCSVNISGENLNDVSEKEFHQFINVAYINAAENNLSLSPFSSFPNLMELEISLNGLKNLNLKPDQFNSLQVLDLSYNKLSGDDVAQIAFIKNLKVLTLTGNKLFTIFKDLNCNLSDQFSKLEVLYLDDNLLFEPDVFSKLASLKSLRELNLDNNFFELIPYLEWNYKTGDFNHRNMNDQLPEEQIDENKVNQKKEDKKAFSIQNNSAKQIRPFKNLKFLSLANNKIKDEHNILAVASWPAIKQLSLQENPLILNTNGTPPLLENFLEKKLNISIQRLKFPKKKPHVHINDDKNRKVGTKIPKIPKQPVDVLINSFRMPLPEIPSSQTPSEIGKVESISEEKLEKNEDCEVSDTVFLTQINEKTSEEKLEKNPQARKLEQKKTPKTERKLEVLETSPTTLDKYAGLELLLDVKPDEKFIQPTGLQNNLKALERMLKHGRVYRDMNVVVDRRYPVYQPEPSKTWMKMPLANPFVYPSKKQQFERELENIRNRTNTIVTMSLTNAFNSTKINQKEANDLLRDIEKKYKNERQQIIEETLQF